MATVYDIVYGAGATLAAPLWLLKGKPRRKALAAVRQHRSLSTHVHNGEPTVLIHAVSLGEINATRRLIDELAAARPGLRFLVTSTTDTGYTRGVELYRDRADVRVLRFPLDFSPVVTRFIRTLHPQLVILMELEVWPNFMIQCERLKIPVVVANGRVTEGSYRNYRRVGAFTAPMFGRLALACVQEKVYAERFAAMGVPTERIQVMGTMKFDTAEIADRIAGADGLAASLGLTEREVLWVCGSTGPGEEAMVLRVYRELLKSHPKLRLAIIPRHGHRFDEVAGLIREAGFELLRRSEIVAGKVTAGSADAVILGDTMGELRKFYSLASVVFAGRSLVDLGKKQHGSDMIEPAALGRPTVVGPFTTNFAEAVNALRGGGGIGEARDEQELHGVVAGWLGDPAAASQVGKRAQDVVRRQQGATRRHVEAILPFLKQDSR
jgi:3-deoxy-D-manno-octulosonic-acid transferase